MRHFLFLAALGALVPLPAFAQEERVPVDEAVAPAPASAPAAPAPTPPSAAPAPGRPAPPARVRDSQWAADYKAARDELIAGEFAAAAGDFTALATAATNDLDRALASEQAKLASEWARQGLVFVRHQDLGESSLSAKAVDKRTGDEIVSLYSTAVVYGIGAGAWVDIVAKPQSSAGQVLPPLLLGGAAIGTVAILDSGRGLRYGVAQSIVSGLYIGLEEGLALTAWKASSTSPMSDQASATLVLATATTGAFVGGFVGERIGTTPGRASFVGSTALWGGVMTGLIGGAVTSSSAHRDAASAPFLAAAVGLNAGAVGGILTAGSVSPSIARVRFIDLGGLGGLLVFEGLYVALANHSGNAQVASGVAAVGAAVGLSTAWAATAGMAPDRTKTRTPDTAPVLPVGKLSPTLMPIKGGAVVGFQGQLL